MIKVAIVGVGNCASSLVQGVEYYKNVREDQFVSGLMHVNFGGYHIRDIKFVAAFDVDANKVGKDISDAIFTPPNCTAKFSDVPPLGVEVMKGPVLDGLGKYLKPVIPVDPAQRPVDVAKVLEDADADVLISYLPVGSYEASRYYAEQAIKAGVGYINCIPEFIVSGKEWAKKFEEAKLPCAGDDIKSQVGATILHRTLTKLLIDRGVKLEESYQLNIGGNSVTGDEEILLEVDGRVIRTRIGDFIDEMMKNYPPTVRDGKDVLNTSSIKEKIKCFTVTDDYKVELAPVTKLIRHKICEPLLEVTLREGNKIKITQDHNLFTLGDDGNLKSIPAKELQSGKTFIVVPTQLAHNGEGITYVDFKRGFEKFFIPRIRLINEAGIKPTTTYKLPAIEKRIILAQLDRVKDRTIREKLEKICNGDIKFVKVKDIKKLDPTPQYVYDLSVEGYERFVCSNILVHNTDFLNMLEEERLSSKRISKTEAVASQVPYEVPLRIGPSDYVPFLKDNKVCYIHIRGRKFGDIPLTLDVKLSVEDSPNSAGVVIDAIRAVKLALDRGVGGPLIGVSAYFFKHPPVQMPDSEARQAVEDFIAGRRER